MPIDGSDRSIRRTALITEVVAFTKYVRKGDLQPKAADGSLLAPAAQVVFAADGKTAVGRMMPGKGFVPNGQSPDAIPDFQTSVEELKAP